MNEEGFEETSESKAEETSETSKVVESESNISSEISQQSSEIRNLMSNVDTFETTSAEATSESASEWKSESLSTTTSLVPTENSEPTQLAKIDYMAYCPYCGAHLEKRVQFCPECGADLRKGVKEKKYFNAKDLNKFVSNNVNSRLSHLSKKGRRNLYIVLGVVACLVLAYLIIGPMPNKIKMEKEHYLYVGEKEAIKYSFKPKNVRKYFKNLTWKSSDKDVVKVNKKGEVTGVSEGSATVTATTMTGAKAKCKLYVIEYDDTTDLEDAYDDYCDSDYASLSDDGTSLVIDTNPYDLDDGDSDYEDDALRAILNVNDALGLPDSVVTRMGETRSIDGTQSYEGEGYYVTWHYHPDQGLEVVYSEE